MNNKKNKAIWLFAGGNMQEYAAKKIKELGYKLIITDMFSGCICKKYADEFITLNTFDIEGNLKAAQKLKDKYKIKAVFAQAADCHGTVAVIADYLKLPGIDFEISRNCHFKEKTRELLTKAGIPQPKFKVVRSVDEAKKAIKKIGLPAVLKATNNSGSRGFSVIKKISDITGEAIKRAIENGTTGHAVLEEALIPIEGEIAEQSLETIWYNGKMHWLNWVDRLFRKDFMLFKTLKTEKLYNNIPWGIEIGHINPAVHDYATLKKVQDLIYKTGCALGMDKQKGGHILKADIMLTKNGPYILEVTLRLSGGWDSSWSTMQRGADFITGALQMALGEELSLDLWMKYFQYKNPNLFASVMTLIPEGAKDCIGRKFAGGVSFDREESIKTAYGNLLKKQYL